LFILEYFKICFYFHVHQKAAHLWQRGAIQVGATEVWGGSSCPKLPPWIRHWLCSFWFKSVIKNCTK